MHWLLSIINGHYDTAAFLLDHKADPNAADQNGPRAVFAAVDMHDMYQSNRPAPKDPGKLDSWTSSKCFWITAPIRTRK